MSAAQRSRLFDAHHRLLVSIGIAAIAFIFLRHLEFMTRAVVTWNAFAGVSLALAWHRILARDAKTTAWETKLQDSNRSAIFLFIVTTAVASVLAVAGLLKSARSGAQQSLDPVFLACITVLISWLLTHTTFTLHYAHVYYLKAETSAGNHHNCGLDFPNESHPGFLDFAYFSFVIGMTCQVSDVQITSKRIRRLALWHGLLSFGFNTVILALTINLASTLLTK